MLALLLWGVPFLLEAPPCGWLAVLLSVLCFFNIDGLVGRRVCMAHSFHLGDAPRLDSLVTAGSLRSAAVLTGEIRVVSGLEMRRQFAVLHSQPSSHGIGGDAEIFPGFGNDNDTLMVYNLQFRRTQRSKCCVPLLSCSNDCC